MLCSWSDMEIGTFLLIKAIIMQWEKKQTFLETEGVVNSTGV